MSYKLKSKMQAIAVTIIIGSGLTGCATVNLNDVAVPSQQKAATEVELNVVQRAASALSMVFRDRGFVANTSSKRLQSAASVLLNGLEEKQIIQTADATYVDLQNSEDVVVADIGFARSYVDRTVAAAEIYLEIAPAKRDLRAELTSLEKALLAATEARDVFEGSLLDQSLPELAAFEESVWKLRDITDEFGVRVRVQDTKTLAMRNQFTDS